MKEESWYKMLVISTILHLLVITATSIPAKKYVKRLDLTSTYSVNLVGDTLGGTEKAPAGAPPAGGAAKIKGSPQKKETEKIIKPQIKKQVPEKKDSKAISLSKKKPPAKHDTPANNSHLTRDELNRLERRIKEIEKKTDYLDVTGMGSSSTSGTYASIKGSGAANRGYGLPVSSQGAGIPLDLVSQKYILEIWEKIRQAWGLPGSYATKKDLESIVTIKIRKDGRIVDINFEKRSGNRFYDESILRAIRSIDPLPAIPPSFNSDIMEIGFRFLPGDIS